MAYTDTPKIGVDLLSKVTPADDPRMGHKLGSQVWGTDGLRYVYAEAGATIAADTAVADINTTTFIAAASGGTYKSPPVAMAQGDRGWFSKASV